MDGRADIKNLAIVLSSCLLLFACCVSAAASAPSSSTSGAQASDAPPAPPDMHSLNDYVEQNAGPMEMSRLGIMVADDSVELDDGTSAMGVAVLKVLAGSPSAGILKCSGAARTVRTAALIAAGAAAAVMFPPALVAVALIGHTSIGESHDVIIGIDGYRVRNTMDLAQAVANDHSGDTVYLAIVRKGRRMMVHLRLP